MEKITNLLNKLAIDAEYVFTTFVASITAIITFKFSKWCGKTLCSGVITELTIEIKKIVKASFKDQAKIMDKKQNEHEKRIEKRLLEMALGNKIYTDKKHIVEGELRESYDAITDLIEKGDNSKLNILYKYRNNSILKQDAK